MRRDFFPSPFFFSTENFPKSRLNYSDHRIWSKLSIKKVFCYSVKAYLLHQIHGSFVSCCSIVLITGHHLVVQMNFIPTQQSYGTLQRWHAIVAGMAHIWVEKSRNFQRIPSRCFLDNLGHTPPFCIHVDNYCFSKIRS